MKRVTPNANPVFAVDAGADHPAGLSAPPMVCVRGVIWVFPSLVRGAVIVGDPEVLFYNVVRAGQGCTCHAVADVFVNGRSLKRMLSNEADLCRYWQDSCKCKRVQR